MKLNKLILITLGIFILLSSFASAELLLHYNFSSLVDYSGNGYGGTNVGVSNVNYYPTFNLSGNSEPNSFYFDGSTSYVSTNLIPSASTFLTYTYSIWVNISSTETGIALGTNDGSTNGINIRFSANKPQCLAQNKQIEGTALNQNTFNFVLCRVNATSLSLWVNGNQLNQTTIGADDFTGDAVVIGCSAVGTNCGDTNRNFQGQIDEVRVYNTSLTNTEIINLYNYNSLVAPESNFSVTTQLNDFEVEIKNGLWDNEINLSGTYDAPSGVTSFSDEPITERAYKLIYNSTTYNVPNRCVNGDFNVNIELRGVNNILQCREWITETTGQYLTITSDFNPTINPNITLIYDLIERINANTTTATSSLQLNDTNLYNISIYADDYDTQNYYNYNISLNGSINTIMIPSTKAIISAYDILTNNEVTTFNITYNDTIYSNSETLTFPTGAGDYNLTFSKDGYYNLTQQFTLNASTNYINFSDVYQTLLNITYKDILNTSSVLNNNGTLNITYNGTEHYYTTTNGTFLIRGLLGNYSNIKARSDGYYYHTGDDFTASNSLENITYYFYLYNSVWLYAKEFSDGTNISNFSVTIYNEDNTYTDDGVNDVKLNGLADGYYKVLFSKDGYYPAEYYITIEAGSFQTLTGYMVNSSEALAEQTIFTAQDIISTNIITGVTISMSKLINSSWVLVSSKATDITGRAQISYIDGIEYKFIMSKDGYNTREFLLMPLYDSYIIRLTPNTTTATNYNVGSWNYYLSNYGIFYDDEENNFDLSLSAGLGTLEYYIAQVSNQTATQTITCLNAYGCSDNIDLPIYNSVETDKVNIYLRVKEVGEVEKAFNYTYLIQDIYGTQTLWAWKDVTESRAEATLLGFSDLERVVIATILMLIVLGALATISVMVGAPTITITGIALIFMIYTLAFLTFVPFYSAHIVGLGALLIVFFGRGNL